MDAENNLSQIISKYSNVIWNNSTSTQVNSTSTQVNSTSDFQNDDLSTYKLSLETPLNDKQRKLDDFLQNFEYKRHFKTKNPLVNKKLIEFSPQSIMEDSEHSTNQNKKIPIKNSLIGKVLFPETSSNPMNIITSPTIVSIDSSTREQKIQSIEETSSSHLDTQIVSSSVSEDIDISYISSNLEKLKLQNDTKLNEFYNLPKSIYLENLKIQESNLNSFLELQQNELHINKILKSNRKNLSIKRISKNPDCNNLLIEYNFDQPKVETYKYKQIVNNVISTNDSSNLEDIKTKLKFESKSESKLENKVNTRSELIKLLFDISDEQSFPKRIVLQAFYKNELDFENENIYVIRDAILIHFDNSLEYNPHEFTISNLKDILSSYYDQLMLQLRKYIPIIVVHDNNTDPSLSQTIFKLFNSEAQCPSISYLDLSISQLSQLFPQYFSTLIEKKRIQEDESNIKRLHNFLFQKIGKPSKDWIQISPPSKISSNLYLGCARNSSNKEELLSLNIVGIINAAKECDNHFPEDFEYLNLKLEDIPEENLSQYFDITYIFIEKIRKSNKACFVHCFVGASRSVAIVIAYVMKKKRWGFKRSYRFIVSKRPETDVNFGFCEQLMAYERELLKIRLSTKI